MPLGDRPKRRATTPADDEKLEQEWRSVNRHRGYLGPSIIEMMWEELDRLVAFILDELGAAEETQNAKAQALGVAYCIALLQNPYTARLSREDAVNSVRQRAMERYYAADDE